MAKERRARLAPRPAPVALAVAAPSGEAGAEGIEPAAAVASAPRRARRDLRSTEHVAALYARVPAATKRRLDVAAAMAGCSLSDVITALLDAHVDPRDSGKQSALEQLVER